MLTDTAVKAAIRGAKARGKAMKRYDGKGLAILVKPNGAALWRFKYSMNGHEKGLSLGPYPDVTLALARDRRDEARKLVAAGTDPSSARKAQKMAQAHSVELIAREWLLLQEGTVSPGTLRRDRRRLEAFVLPYLGKRPINTIEPPDLLEVLQRIEKRGLRETAHRTLSVCSRVWALAIVTTRAKRNIASDLEGALKKTTVKNMAAITDPRQFGKLLREIERYDDATEVVRAALKLTPYVFARPGEIRHMEWSEVNLDGENPEWRIPKEKTKMKDEHIVPLAPQAVTILRGIASHTAPSESSPGGKYVFPSARGGARPMSENAINLALKSLGFDGHVQVAHGFRASASSMLNDLGYKPGVIELQLAHKRRGVAGAYDRSKQLAERRLMMTAWADYLDGLRRGDDNVVPIRKSA